MKRLSVTEVIGYFTAQTFSAIDPDVLRNAARRGTAVHKACASLARGMYVLPLEGIEKKFFLSYLKWFNEYVAEVLWVEHEIVHPVYQYVGHIDLVAVLLDGRRMVIDLKTPAAESKTWRLQLAAYLELVRIKAGLTDYGCMSLRLGRDGGPAKATVYESDAVDFAIFLSALNVARYLSTK